MKTKQSMLLNEEAFEELQLRKMDSPVCLWFLLVSLKSERWDHTPEMFQLNCRFRQSAKYHILFCLIRNNCIEPTCTVNCNVYLSGGWYFAWSNKEKINMIWVVMISTICYYRSCVIHTNTLLDGNRPVVNQQRHLEVGYETAYLIISKCLVRFGQNHFITVLHTVFINIKANCT